MREITGVWCAGHFEIRHIDAACGSLYAKEKFSRKANVLVDTRCSRKAGSPSGGGGQEAQQQDVVVPGPKGFQVLETA
jgi:hypothetical protein